MKEAGKIIAKYSNLPAVCGRVCPQETQCEGKCILGIKGEAVSIGKLERFVGDWVIENGIEFEIKEKSLAALNLIEDILEQAFLFISSA